jgi:prepilin-type N-terminal cleavage/methylation domain-containing protein
MRGEISNFSLIKLLEAHKPVRDDSRSAQNQYGVTLVELLSVIAVIAIISTIALMQFGSSKQQFKRQNVAQELKSAFERARFDSVKRRADSTSIQAKVVIDAGSFTLVTDNNANGSTGDPEDSRTTDFSGQNVSITSTLSLPATVYFNKRGEVTDSGGVSMSPSFLVCNPSCTISGGNSNANSSNASLVLVTPTGTVNLLAGGSAIPTFAAPSPLSNVAGSTGIRNDVIINGN